MVTPNTSIAYVVKFAIVDSQTILNVLEPNAQRIQRLNEKCQFFEKLEASIITEGIRNPIVLNAWKNKIENRYGGSRLLMAKKLKIPVPAIIADFENVFPDAEVLKTIDEIKAKYKDVPKKIYYKPYGLNISGCAHYHLGES